MDMSIVDKAEEFARNAHKSINQKRKYTDEDYIVHPEEVVSLIKKVPHTPEMLAAAWLRDVVEDVPGITNDKIRKLFGDKIAEYVWFLTDVSKLEDGNRKVRKRLDQEHITKAPAEVKTIKLADLISNSESIMEYASKFAAIYMKEKQDLLKVLEQGDACLLDIAKQQISDYFATRSQVPDCKSR